MISHPEKAVPRSGRLIVAQHFSAGSLEAVWIESAKRTTERFLTNISAVRFTDSPFSLAVPSTKVLGYYQSSATPTWRLVNLMSDCLLTNATRRCRSFQRGSDAREVVKK